MELKPIYRRVIGLLRGSFIPPAHIRYLRLIARHRQKLGGMLASEKTGCTKSCLTRASVLAF